MRRQIRLEFDEITLGSSGAPMGVDWRPVSGANDVAVDSASIQLLPPRRDHPGRSLGTVGGAHDGQVLAVDIPGGVRAIRSLTLNGLKVERSGNMEAVHGEAGLGGLRIAVAVVENGVVGAPVVTVPAIGQRGSIPPQLTGGRLNGRTLSLPDLRAARLEVTVVEGGTPEDFSKKRFSTNSVSARAAPYPEALEVLGADGAPLWSLPTPLVESSFVDLRSPLELALQAALKRGERPSAQFTLRAATPGEALTAGLLSKGTLLRRFDERVAGELDGRAVTLPLPGAPLDAGTPSFARADVSVRHHGLRIHPISDLLPEGIGGTAGRVVVDEPVVRALPPAALRGETIRRVGLVGRAAEACDLSVRLVELVDEQGVGPIDGAPAVIAVEPPASAVRSVSPELHWAELPAGVAVESAVGIEVTATRGRFLWIGEPDPLVLIAVEHGDPAGESVDLGGQSIELAGLETNLTDHSLHPQSFRGAPPVARTDQLCSVTLSNLTLGYSR